MTRLITLLFFLWPSLLWADILRPETLDDTLALQLEALNSDPRIIAPVIDPTDKSIRFSLGGDTPYIIYPDNLHKLLQGAESDASRQAVLDSFIQRSLGGLFDATAEAPIDPATILPVIREGNFGKIDDGDPPVSRVLAGALSIFLVQDLPTSLSYIRASDLAGLGLEEDAAFALAQSNQAARQWMPKIEGDGLYFLQLDGNFEASLLLDNAFWDFVEAEIGPVLLTASNRDVVLFGPKDDPEARRILTQLAQKYVTEGSYALSAQLMVRQDGGWVVSE